LAEIGKYEEALECFDKDLKFNKKSFETLYQKAVVLHTLDKPRDAVECFNKAWEVKHAEFLKLTDQAHTLKNHKKFERAVLHFDDAKNVKPIPIQFWHIQGLALHDIKRFEEANRCFDEALKLDENEPEVIYDKSRSQLMLDNTEECLTLLEKACKIDGKKRKRLLVDQNFEKLRNDQRFRLIRDYGRIPAPEDC